RPAKAVYSRGRGGCGRGDGALVAARPCFFEMYCPLWGPCLAYTGRFFPQMNISLSSGRPQGPTPHIHATPAPTRGSSQAASQKTYPCKTLLANERKSAKHPELGRASIILRPLNRLARPLYSSGDPLRH